MVIAVENGVGSGLIEILLDGWEGRKKLLDMKKKNVKKIAGCKKIWFGEKKIGWDKKIAVD
jgi:hypothetical protein